MNRLLVKNGTIVTLEDRNRILEGHAVLVENGVIRRSARSPLFAGCAPVCWNAPRRVVLPGFINAHTHFYSSFARGLTKSPAGCQLHRGTRASLVAAGPAPGRSRTATGARWSPGWKRSVTAQPPFSTTIPRREPFRDRWRRLHARSGSSDWRASLCYGSLGPRWRPDRAGRDRGEPPLFAAALGRGGRLKALFGLHGLVHIFPE